MADIKPVYKRVSGIWRKQTAYERQGAEWVLISTRLPVDPIDPPEPLPGGDYSGTTPPLGYAWCLGKAVPVYNQNGFVTNPQYARFYINELPAFSAEDYPYITVSFVTRLLRFTEEDFLALMGRGAFETVGDFPFMSLLHRTDLPGSSPYGFNWVSAGDDRAYAIVNYSDEYDAPEGAEYFDLYLRAETMYKVSLSCAIRYNGEEDFRMGITTIKVDRGGTALTINNASKYLVLTSTPERKE